VLGFRLFGGDGCVLVADKDLRALMDWAEVLLCRNMGLPSLQDLQRLDRKVYLRPFFYSLSCLDECGFGFG
jgi:hypothetical protein